MHNLNIFYILTIQAVTFRQMVGKISNLGLVHRKMTSAAIRWMGKRTKAN